MNWEEEALRDVIRMLIQEDVKWDKRFIVWNAANIDLSIENPAYIVLQNITKFEYLFENVDDFSQTDGTNIEERERLVEMCHEEIKSN